MLESNPSTRRLLVGCAALLWAASAIFSSDVKAQSGAHAYFPQPNPAARIVRQNTFRPPTVSPYLNLLPGDLSDFDVGRYQVLVRPQIEAYRAAQRQQSDISRLQREIAQLGQVSPAVPQAVNSRPLIEQPVFSTGHPSYFSTYSHYYPSLGR